MNHLISKLKKSASYLYKLIKDPRKKDIWWLIKHVQPRYRLDALKFFSKGQNVPVKLKGNLPPQFINTFLKGLHSKRERIIHDFYRWDFNGKIVFATPNQILGLQNEYLAGVFSEIYDYDWTNKVVLDIGGFVGDSALFFFERGARKVIVYEPVSENFTAINLNLEGFKESVEVHEKAISQIDGPICLYSHAPEGSLGFGLEKGKHSIHCDGISFRSLLKKHCVDVIKIDCEGAEIYLEELSQSEIANVPYWIVETHTKEIYNSLTKKFGEYGFSVVNEFSVNPIVDLIHFELNHSDK